MNHRELIAALTPLHGAGEARAIVRMVMEERFGLSQTDLLLGKDTTLSSRDRAEFKKIAERLLTGEPVQHVLGYAYFCGHRFRVTPDVLIPRPETEELTRWAIDELNTLNPQPLSLNRPLQGTTLLDLCTGSGCIAISLALAFPQAHVVGVDISDAALSIARDNARSLNASNVDFLEYNILSEDAESSPPWRELERGFTLLVSNPPYVRDCEASEMSPTVLDHEPSLALFVPDDDPLRFYRAIAAIGQRCLLPGTPVLMEVNTALAGATRQLFIDAGYHDVEVRDDQFSRPRMVKAVL
ncbi:MAG: peptide chain release factor N(5)-glutamine methyltransferase [Prevotella sp.]|nr:peptide chain release factor N(5)-glutamine methyltransferase [Prevotella sp.]